MITKLFPKSRSSLAQLSFRLQVECGTAVSAVILGGDHRATIPLYPKVELRRSTRLCLVLSVVFVSASLAQPKQEDEAPLPRKISCTVQGLRRPIAGARAIATFTLSTDRDKKVHEALYLTDKQGKYSIEVPEKLADNPDLQLSVVVDHRGYLPRRIGPVAVSGFRKPDIHRYRVYSDIIYTRIRSGRVVSGTVVLPNGSPAVGAEVTIATKYLAYSWKFPDPSHYRASETAITDDEGKFTLLADNRATMMVALADQAPLVVDNLHEYKSPVAKDPPNTYRLPIGIRPRGRVTTHDGEPIPHAIVQANRRFVYNESDMPIAFSRSCVADAEGNYEMPPLPADTVVFGVNSRIVDPKKSNASTLLSHVVLDITKELNHRDREPVIDFRAQETITVTAEIRLPPSGVAARRAPLISVTGRVKGASWIGTSLPAQPPRIVKFRIPKGAEGVSINTGRVDIQRAPGEPFETTVHWPLGTVTEDIDGVVIRLK